MLGVVVSMELVLRASYPSQCLESLTAVFTVPYTMINVKELTGPGAVSIATRIFPMVTQIHQNVY
jgi:hypothetical protein